MSHKWLRFRYRDFYDVPRAILVEYRNDLYFFDCPFNDRLDDYDELYSVYKVPEELRSEVEVVSWKDLHTRCRHVGTVSVDKVEFDSTKRQTINSKILDELFPFSNIV